MTDTELMPEPEHEQGIVLPCKHLAPRPAEFGAVIACQCGRIWNVRPEPGGHSWKAQELTD